MHRDLRKFKEAKKQFDKVSEEKEAALSKNAQAPRNKQHEVEEATNIFNATRKCFRHIVLDYVLQVRALNPLRRDSVLTFVQTPGSLHHSHKAHANDIDLLELILPSWLFAREIRDVLKGKET